MLPRVALELSKHPCVVIEAPPGAGKTTRVPSALAEASFIQGQIWVLEPRRIAARLAARYIAAERGQPVGQDIGMRVRFEDQSSAKTRVLFVTEGVFLRRATSDPTLKGIAAVVLDEFHERHWQTDASLAIAWNLVRGARPDLKVVVMSATLDAQPIAAYLGGCPVITSRGKRFDVEVEYDAEAENRPLETSVRAAVRKIYGAERSGGHTLVFLPGAAEIRRAKEALAEVQGALDIDVLALHGDLSTDEQDRAVAPSSRRKVILSTNIAESSVTIDGVTAVVDSGLQRVPSTSPWTGISALRVEKVSRASATQRAGRAGRTAPGKAIRLYARLDHDARPALDRPEIERLDVSELLLQLAGAKLRARSLAWLAPPPKEALDAAEKLLARLGALDASGDLTDVGRRMLEFPASPRLARVLVEAERRGVLRLAARAAAILSERGGTSRIVDLVTAVDVLWREASFPMKKSAEQLEKIGKNARGVAPPTGARADEALVISMLAGFPDRVAERRVSGAEDLFLSSGGSAKLTDRAAFAGQRFILAVDVEERSGGKGLRGLDVTRLRLGCGIEPEWLLEVAGDALVEESAFVLEGANGRVIETKRLRYEQLVLEERRAPLVTPSEDSARFLLERAKKVRASNSADRESVDRLAHRIAFLRRAMPELEIPSFEGDAVDAGLLEVARSAVSLEEITSQSSTELLLATLPPEVRRRLDELAPSHVRLGSREVRVEYSADAPPYIASRMQDFFGLVQGPLIAKGRARLVLHLLAPNHRAVQVTDDLSGFWDRTYAEVRGQLMRRYPRHDWPENPRIKPPPRPPRSRQ